MNKQLDYIKPLVRIIQKNFKILLRSRSSALIIILGPLFLILLLGIAFNNTNSMALSIGVYSDSYNAVIDGFIERLSEKQYSIEKMQSELDCINQIKVNKINACVIFPADIDLEKGTGNNTVTFYVDNSRINMVFIIIEALSSKFSDKSKEISMDLTNTLLQKLESTRVEIFNKKPVLSMIKKGSKESVDSLEKIKLDLDSLDISVNSNDFKIGAVNGKIIEVDEATVMVQQLQPKLDDVYTALSDIDSDATALRNTGNSAAIDDLKLTINSTKALITESKTLIDSQQLTAVKKMMELKLLIKDININIEKTKNKISDVASSRNSISKSIDSIKAKMQGVYDSIDDVDSSFKKIDENIGSIQITDADKIVNPIKTSIKGVETEITYLEGLFPSLLMIVIMFIAVLLSTSLIMIEKKSPAYFRNRITPLDDLFFLLGDYLTAVIIVTLQVLIIVVISSLLFKIKLFLPTLQMLPFIMLIISLFSFIGILIGKVFTSEETAAVAAVSLSTILLFLSDIIVPLGMMPGIIRGVARFSPLVISSDFLKIGLKHGISSVMFQFYFILAYAVVLLAIVVLLEKLNTKRFLTNLILAQENKFLEKKKLDLKEQKDKLLFK